ncbi:MAG: methyltransferase domain-containing protein [Nitrospirota bacterium]
MGSTYIMNRWLLENMECPRHHTALSCHANELMCPNGCRFPVIDGVPVMLLEEVQQTMESTRVSLPLAKEESTDGGLYVESLGLSEEEKSGILDLASSGQDGIDPVVSFLVAATNGIAYKSQIGSLSEYPIPVLRAPLGKGKVLLDVGCSWGRWSTAASRKGYKVIGIDPSLGAVMAARRVAQQLGTEATFIVGDARFLPLKQSVIDYVFSYSVLQHLSREHVAVVVSEIGRVLRDKGACCVQMPAKFGLRCLYHQFRRKFQDGSGFEVRYWSLPALKKLFSPQIGTTTFSVDCFFGIGLQYSDLRFMPPALKAVVTVSEGLRRISRSFPPLIWVADSVYVSSIKDGAAR